MRQSRRAFLRAAAASSTLVALSVCGAPPAPPKVYSVGWLSSLTEASPGVDYLRQAFRELGYVEGRNLSLDVRYTEGRNERFPIIAAELVALRLDVIMTRASQGVLALQQATSSIPIVMAGGISDVVEAGFVASLARPGGNITGVYGAASEIAGRRLQLLKEAVPTASRVAYLFDSSSDQQVRNRQYSLNAAPTLGIALLSYDVRTAPSVTDALVAVGSSHSNAIVVAGGATRLQGEQQRVIDFLSSSRLPSMVSGIRTWVEKGALLFYDENDADSIRNAATYVDRILRGANPADLPCAKATKFDFVINLKTANAFGLKIPSSVLAQTSEQIQ